MAAYSIFEGTLADMTWPGVSEAAERGALMLVPVAVIEQHGPHLPLATDTYAAHLLCLKIREALAGMNVEAVIAPPYYLGMNPSTGMFPGSIHISKDTMVQALSDYLANLGRFGFKRQFILNHHGDPQHNDALARAIEGARWEGMDAFLVLGGWIGEIVEEVYLSAFGHPFPLPNEALVRARQSAATREARQRLMRSQCCIHAEERETSLIMRYFPELLDESRGTVDRLPPVLPSPEELASATEGGKWRAVSPLGYIGEPGVATPENGELYALEAADIAAAIKDVAAGGTPKGGTGRREE